MPAPMPKVLQKKVRPEVTQSKPLSLFARRGNVGIQARRIALLVANGVDGEQAQALAARIRSEGAVPVFVAPKLGAVIPATGERLQADASLEVAPAVVFDAVAVCDGPESAAALAANGRALEFLKDQYRHCKAIFVSGSASLVMEKAGIPLELPTGDPDTGIVTGAAGEPGGVDAFIAAVAMHRHYARESDPPLV
jgi:catalase